MKKSDIVLGLIELIVLSVAMFIGMAWAETGDAKAGRWTIVLCVIALFGAAVLRVRNGKDG